MYKVDVRVDGKEAAAIERRRIQEYQRQSRIFNAKQRLIGVDVKAMEEQVSEKKMRESIEQQRHEAFASDMIRNDKIAELLEQRRAMDLKQLNQALNDYRQEEQRVVDRKEFDLNDPDAKKKDLPARVSDTDPRLSVSGMQMFQGEDLNYEGRKQDQQEQRREWTKLQMAEKRHRAEEESFANRLYSMKARELDERLVDLAIAEEKTRRELNMATKEYNRVQANEKKARQQLEHTQEEENNLTEISNVTTGDLLSENPEVAVSAFGPHRVIPDRWKGMSPEQLEKIRETQAIQREERKVLQNMEKQSVAEWDRRCVAEARAGLLLERQVEKKRKELQKQLAEENRQLAMEQKARKEHVNHELYTNKPTDEYFAQFNTSSR